MPKMKSNRGASKRFRATGGGRDQARQGREEPHPLEQEPEAEAGLRKSALVHPTNEKSIRRLLPYL